MTHPALRERTRAARAGRLAVGLLAAAFVVTSLSSCALRRLGQERTVPWVFTQRDDQSAGWLWIEAGIDESWPMEARVLWYIGPGHCPFYISSVGTANVIWNGWVRSFFVPKAEEPKPQEKEKAAKIRVGGQEEAGV
jgi:hypothetical protein